MTTSASSGTLRATLAHFAAQARDVVFDQFLAILDAQAEHELPKPIRKPDPNPDPDPDSDAKDLREARRRARNAASKRRQRVTEHLRALQAHPFAEAKGPLKRKVNFAAALPIEDPELKPGPLFSSERPPTQSVIELATFFHRQWERHFDLGRTHRLELFCHPDSLNYNEERELAHRSEASVGSLQLSALLTRKYCSPDAEVRASATTFRRAPNHIRWDDYQPSQVGTFYYPEARYTFKRQEIAVCLPEGYCWGTLPEIATFLDGVMRLLSQNWKAYEFWCPGLCRCPDSPAALKAFLARTKSTQSHGSG